MKMIDIWQLKDQNILFGIRKYPSYEAANISVL